MKHSNTTELTLSTQQAEEASSGLIPLDKERKAVAEIQQGVLVASGPVNPRNSTYGIEAWAREVTRKHSVEIVLLPKGPKSKKCTFEIIGQVARGDMNATAFENGGVQYHIKRVRDQFDPQTRFFFEEAA